MAELRPCPFCGKDAIVSRDEKRRGCVTVGCWNVCSARPSVFVHGVDYKDGEQEAVKRWNRRASDA